MKDLLISLLSGVLFGIGLAVAGMTQADKVINFLDLADAWDPSLAFVMGGAIGVHFIAYRIVKGRSAPFFGGRFGIPTRKDIDLRLVAGSALFGIGWALGGYCPGPGLVSLLSGATNAVVFVGFLLVGMVVWSGVEDVRKDGHGDTAPHKADVPHKSEIPNVTNFIAPDRRAG